MAGKVSLDISISDYPHTRSILSGEKAKSTIGELIAPDFSARVTG